MPRHQQRRGLQHCCDGVGAAGVIRDVCAIDCCTGGSGQMFDCRATTSGFVTSEDTAHIPPSANAVRGELLSGSSDSDEEPLRLHLIRSPGKHEVGVACPSLTEQQRTYYCREPIGYTDPVLSVKPLPVEIMPLRVTRCLDPHFSGMQRDVLAYIEEGGEGAIIEERGKQRDEAPIPTSTTQSLVLRHSSHVVPCESRAANFADVPAQFRSSSTQFSAPPLPDKRCPPPPLTLPGCCRRVAICGEAAASAGARDASAAESLAEGHVPKLPQRALVDEKQRQMFVKMNVATKALASMAAHGAPITRHGSLNSYEEGYKRTIENHASTTQRQQKGVEVNSISVDREIVHGTTQGETTKQQQSCKNKTKQWHAANSNNNIVSTIEVASLATKRCAAVDVGAREACNEHMSVTTFTTSPSLLAVKPTLNNAVEQSGEQVVFDCAVCCVAKNGMSSTCVAGCCVCTPNECSPVDCNVCPVAVMPMGGDDESPAVVYAFLYCEEGVIVFSPDFVIDVVDSEGLCRRCGMGGLDDKRDVEFSANFVGLEMNADGHLSITDAEATKEKPTPQEGRTSEGILRNFDHCSYAIKGRRRKLGTPRPVERDCCGDEDTGAGIVGGCEPFIRCSVGESLRTRSSSCEVSFVGLSTVAASDVMRWFSGPGDEIFFDRLRYSHLSLMNDGNVTNSSKKGTDVGEWSNGCLPSSSEGQMGPNCEERNPRQQTLQGVLTVQCASHPRLHGADGSSLAKIKSGNSLHSCDLVGFALVQNSVEAEESTGKSRVCTQCFTTVSYPEEEAHSELMSHSISLKKAVLLHGLSRSKFPAPAAKLEQCSKQRRCIEQADALEGSMHILTEKVTDGTMAVFPHPPLEVRTLDGKHPDGSRGRTTTVLPTQREPARGVAARRRRCAPRKGSVLAGLIMSEVPDIQPVEVDDTLHCTDDKRPANTLCGGILCLDGPLPGSEGVIGSSRGRRGWLGREATPHRLQPHQPLMPVEVGVPPNEMACEIEDFLRGPSHGLRNGYLHLSTKTPPVEHGKHADGDRPLHAKEWDRHVRVSKHVPRRQCWKRSSNTERLVTNELAMGVTPSLVHGEVFEAGLEYLSSGERRRGTSRRCGMFLMRGRCSSTATRPISVIPDLGACAIDDQIFQVVPCSPGTNTRKLGRPHSSHTPYRGDVGRSAPSAGFPFLSRGVSPNLPVQRPPIPLKPVSETRFEGEADEHQVRKSIFTKSESVGGSSWGRTMDMLDKVPSVNEKSAVVRYLLEAGHSPNKQEDGSTSSPGTRKTPAHIDALEGLLPEPSSSGIKGVDCGGGASPLVERCEYKREGNQENFVDTIPATQSEVEHLEEVRNFIEEMLGKAACKILRRVTVDEIEGDSVAMELVFENEDMSQACRHRPSLISYAYLRDIQAAIIGRIVEISRGEPPSETLTRPLAIRDRGRQQLVEVSASTTEAATPSSMGSFNAVNPRSVPQPWAHLCHSDLETDDKFQTVVNQYEDTPHFEERVLAYLRKLSEQKEVQNERIFNEYPFLPPLPYGVPLSEVMCSDNPTFRQCTTRLMEDPYDSGARCMMCKVVLCLAKIRANVRNKEPINALRCLGQTVRQRGVLNGANGQDFPGNLASQDDGELPKWSCSSGFSDVRMLQESSRGIGCQQFPAHCKQDLPLVLNRWRRQMKLQETENIQLSPGDIWLLRFLYNGVAGGRDKALGYSDLEGFMKQSFEGVLDATPCGIHQLLQGVRAAQDSSHVVEFDDFVKLVMTLAVRRAPENNDHPPNGRLTPLGAVPQCTPAISRFPNILGKRPKLVQLDTKVSRSPLLKGGISNVSLPEAPMLPEARSVNTFGKGKPRERRGSAGVSGTMKRIVVPRPATAQRDSASTDHLHEAALPPLMPERAQAWASGGGKKEGVVNGAWMARFNPGVSMLGV